jgi:Zn-dependent M28 family amino/carboxypeptidase
MMNQVNMNTVRNYDAGLSGEFPVVIGGEDYTIATRYTYTTLPIQKATQYTYEHFQGLGLPVSYHNYTISGNMRRNVIAEQAGIGQPDRIFLVTAHLDDTSQTPTTYAPGADDNASALVVLLEVANRLKRATVTRPMWLVAFCLEEHGLLGSQAFVARLKKTGQTPVGTMILECVGYASHEAGSQRTPPGVPIPVPTVGNFLGIIGNEASRNLVAAIERGARRVSPQLPTVALSVPSRGETLPDVRRSDHAAFWDEGYSAVMLTDTANFRNPHYHQPTDTIDTLDLDFLEGVIEIVMGCIEDLAGLSSR